MTNIKSSSGKIIGFTDIQGEEIIIHNNTKPELRFIDKEVLEDINTKSRKDYIIKKLYDYYFLGIGEIASLYDVCYSNMNKQWRQIPMDTTAKQNRRNRSFGKKQKIETREKISNSLNEGYKSGRLTPTTPYERTPEIKEKISRSLKEYFKKHPQDPTPHINNWKNGVYEKVDFGHGIGGHYYSFKNKRKMYFRSLLELYYALMLEEDNKIVDYSYETLKITCDNGHTYTPDFIVNNQVIELKARKYVYKQEEVLQKFLYKKEQGEKFCKKRGLNFKVIFDDEIGFESRQFKRHLKNHSEIIDYYNIEFNNPERMVIK